LSRCGGITESFDSAGTPHASTIPTTLELFVADNFTATVKANHVNGITVAKNLAMFFHISANSGFIAMPPNSIGADFAGKRCALRATFWRHNWVPA
jgi:hypothetical protein